MPTPPAAPPRVVTPPPTTGQQTIGQVLNFDQPTSDERL